MYLKIAEDIRERTVTIFKDNDFYIKMVDEVILSLTTVISSYKKGEDNPLDSLKFLQKDLKILFKKCLREFNSYYSLHCLEERVFLFFSLFLINHKDGRKTIELKKEKDKLIVYMLQRFKQSQSATNGDFKQFLGELGQFIAIMTLVFIFMPLLKKDNKLDENASKAELESEITNCKKEMITLIKTANPNFTENNIEELFLNHVTNFDIKKSTFVIILNIIELELDDNYIRLEDIDYINIGNKILDVFNPMEFLEVILNYDYA